MSFTLCPTLAFSKALERENSANKIPDPVKVTALIDTGFRNGLVIEKNLVSEWGLEPKNIAHFIGIRPEGDYHDYYGWESDVAIRFQTDPNLVIDPIPAGLMDLSGYPHFQAIIGCQILQMTSIIYEGPKRSLKLVLPVPRGVIRSKK